MSPEAAFEAIAHAIRADGGDLETPARHDITPPIDVFDHVRIFAISDGGAYRVLQRTDGAQMRTIECDDVAVERPLLAAFQYLETNFERPF
jgi:hypothetical protein